MCFSGRRHEDFHGLLIFIFLFVFEGELSFDKQPT